MPVSLGTVPVSPPAIESSVLEKFCDHGTLNSVFVSIDYEVNSSCKPPVVKEVALTGLDPEDVKGVPVGNGNIHPRTLAFYHNAYYLSQISVNGNGSSPSTIYVFSLAYPKKAGKLH
jgi:hypothetical protein